MKQHPEIPSTHHKNLKHYNHPGHAHELTFSCYHQRDYLHDASACQLLLSEIEKARELYKFRLWAYVFMPTHVHLLIWPFDAAYSISDILNDIKGKMSKQYRDHICSKHPDRMKEFSIFDNSKKRTLFRFWQTGGGFDRNLWNAEAIRYSIDYIEANPVRKKLANTPEEYPWSSAFARANNKGLIPDLFNLPVAMPNVQYQRLGLI